MNVGFVSLFVDTKEVLRASLNAKVSFDLATLENTIGDLLAGKISETAAESKLRMVLGRLAAYPVQGNKIRSTVFNLANKAYLAGKREIAGFLIASLHKKISTEKLSIMQENYRYASNLLIGIQYNQGYVNGNGQIVLAEYLRGTRIRQIETSGSPTSAMAVLGLNCIHMNNILANLTIGAADYTSFVGRTDEDVFKKSEFTRQGVYGFPVIKKYPGTRLGDLAGLLGLYGDYFAVQLYHSDGKPFHTLFIYRGENGYNVMDTLASEGSSKIFNGIGGLTELANKYGAQFSYSFNLIDTDRAMPVSKAKSRSWLLNFAASVSKAKSELAGLKQARPKNN